MAFSSKKLLDWHHRIQAMNFHTLPNRGALWTGFKPDEALRLALLRERSTLEMTLEGQSLNQGALKRMLQEDFGPSWCPEKQKVWTMASQRYVSRVSGKVEVFIKQGSTSVPDYIRQGESEAAAVSMIDRKIMFDEMMDMEIAGQVVGNGRIEAVSITEFNDKMEPTNTYSVPISKEWN